MVDNGSVDLAEPASVIAAPGTAAILRVLVHADDTFTIHQLGVLAGVSNSYAAKSVAQLAEHGLVLVEQRGTAKLVRLNREHLAADAVSQLVQLHGRLRDLMSAEFAAWSIPPVHASLFGSAARGDGGTQSDLDILLLRADQLDTDDPQWTDQLFRTANRLRAATGNAVSWFELTMEDLRRAAAANEPIIEDWMQDSATLYGPDVRTILKGIP
jgi:predicted nucleotidyltransferase